MPLTKAEKIRIIAKRRHIKLSEIADALNMTRQNLNGKLNRDTFTPEELNIICELLNCTHEEYFTLNDTGERI